MKNLKSIFSLAVLSAVILFFTACGSSGGDDDTPSATDQQGAKLAKTGAWALSEIIEGPSKDELAKALKDMKLVITYDKTTKSGSMAVTGDGYPTANNKASLFKGVSSWSFKGEDVTKLVLPDNGSGTWIKGDIAIKLTAEGETNILEMSFETNSEIPQLVKTGGEVSNARIERVSGKYTLTFR
ncbi:MAG: hypothetical protein MI784_18285 [Cytophagales bacterium]|nr:hypothetical protein [Cytophagales bacterium]